MSEFISSFTNVALVMTIAFVIVQSIYYFKLKRNVNLSDIDKDLWRLRFFTIFLAALVFVAMFYLPSTGFYRDIELSPSAPEIALQDLVRNQQSMGNQLHQLREVMYLLLMMLMVYLVWVASIVGRLFKEKQRQAFINDPAVKKPLGLETD